MHLRQRQKLSITINRPHLLKHWLYTQRYLSVTNFKPTFNKCPSWNPESHKHRAKNTNKEREMGDKNLTKNLSLQLSTFWCKLF